MTEAQARKLADLDRYYRPMQLRSGRWIVWDDKSEHEVEFTPRGVWEDLELSPRELFKEFCGGEA